MQAKTATNTDGEVCIFDEESHTYRVGDTKLTSVTTLIHEWFPPFDSQKQAAKYALKHGETAEYWIEQWAQSAVFGSHVHAHAEAIVLGRKRIPKAKTASEMTYFQVVRRFIEEKLFPSFEPVASERMLFNTKLKVAGTCDLILYSKKKGRYLVGDWKTNKTIYTRGFGGTGFRALAHLDDCNYIHYCLQLNIYRLLLEMMDPGAGYDEADMMLYHVTANGVQPYSVPRMDAEANIVLKCS